MPEQSSRPWYDLVMERAAVKGWGISELARRAKIGRPTIYGWRDAPDGNKLQASPVNAVADLFGIPREKALRLAGIIPREGSAPAPEPADVLAEVWGKDTADRVRKEVRKRAPRDAEAVLRGIEDIVRQPSSAEESAPRRAAS